MTWIIAYLIFGALMGLWYIAVDDEMSADENSAPGCLLMFTVGWFFLLPAVYRLRQEGELKWNDR